MGEKIIESSFSIKLNITDSERTEIKFKLDFSKLSEEQVREWAARAITQEVNRELRENLSDSSKGKKLEDIQEKTIEVKPFERTGRGKVSESKALETLAKSHGISVEELSKLLAKAKGAAK